jgi:hypothetical protein
MDDTTMNITEICLSWFYRLITYVKLLIFILYNVNKNGSTLKVCKCFELGIMKQNKLYLKSTSDSLRKITTRHHYESH